jgi:hypothetical protein
VKQRPITVEEALAFAEEHARIESTDDEVENVLAAEVRRLRVEIVSLQAALAVLREDNQHLSDQAANSIGTP